MDATANLFIAGTITPRGETIKTRAAARGVAPLEIMIIDAAAVPPTIETAVSPSAKSFD